MTKLNIGILAGGAGTRLWPLSTLLKPKQFISINGEESLLSQTIRRFSSLNGDVVVSGNIIHEKFLLSNIAGSKCQSIICESGFWGTAFSVGCLAYFYANESCDESPLLIVPSDSSWMEDNDMIDVVEGAASIIKDDDVILFGVTPNKITSSFGYILLNTNDEASFLKKGVGFIEKPSIGIAKNLIEAGALWNSGMFMALPKTFLSLLENYAPTIYADVQNFFLSIRTLERETVDIFLSNFSSATQQGSFDVEVLQNISTNQVKKDFFLGVCRLKGGWNDLGTWEAISDFWSRDKLNNLFYGNCYAKDSNSNIVYAPNKKIILNNVDNIAVVESDQYILVSDKSSMGSINKFYKNNSAEIDDAYLPGFTKRPWGGFYVLYSADDLVIKEIRVMPGAKISLQTHKFRSEHWTIKSGFAKIRVGDNHFNLKQGQTTYIPKDTLHRVENVGEVSLVIVELQMGELLSEGDIVRYDDDYGRVKNV